MLPGSAPSIGDCVRERLSVLQPESIELLDESGNHIGHEGAKGGGGHYRLVIVAPSFARQPLQTRHRMIYQALGSLMQREIHALAIKAYAPDEI